MKSEQFYSIGDVKVSDIQAVHLPANLVLFNFNGEEVVLGFGCRRFNEQQTADITHFFHLSIPQFIKTHKMIADAYNNLIESGQFKITFDEAESTESPE